MQYHGGWAGIMINGRTRLQRGCEWDYDGQRYINEVLLPHDCLDSEGTPNVSYGQRVLRSKTPLKMWGMLWGGKLLARNYPPTNKNTLIRALTEEWDKLPQQLLDNVVQSMGTTCGMLHHSTVDISVLIPFFKGAC
ncbi:hypothetical protein TNCV_3761271 [Trichonephila clavipes]|nr:hypothetical protein TNCV_3761271 [Trichonephila clavipes]